MALPDRPALAAVGLPFLLPVVFQQAATGLPVAMDRDGLAAAQYGLVISLNGILIVALQLPLSRRLEGSNPGRLLVLASLLCGGGSGLDTLAGGAALYAIAVVAWTLGEIVRSPVNTGLIARFSPDVARGSYRGIHALSWATATMAAPLCAGIVIDRFDPNPLWATCTVLGVCAAVGYWALLLGKPDRDRHPPHSSSPRQPDCSSDSNANAEGTWLAPTPASSPRWADVTSRWSAATASC